MANVLKIRGEDNKFTHIRALIGPKGADGERGPQGEPGPQGADGYSPVANVVSTETGATITITDKNGTTTAEVHNGRDADPYVLEPATSETLGGIKVGDNLEITEDGVLSAIASNTGSSLFEPLPGVVEGEIYDITAHNLQSNTIYEIPRGIEMGYTDDSGVLRKNSGYINNETYINSFRAFSIFDTRFTVSSGSNYASFITTYGNPSNVYGAGISIGAISGTSPKNKAILNSLSQPVRYIPYDRLAGSLPTTYQAFDTKVLSGNCGYRIRQELDSLSNQISELELFKFPNVTIFGEPTISNGQISDFSNLNYLEFPFLVDFKGRNFEINFQFTTGTNVDNQENILDSEFGLAFAIRNKHFILALSYNGTSWVTEQIGTLVVEPDRTYKVKISWDNTVYKVQYSTDGGNTYVDDIQFNGTTYPYPKQMYIGISKLSNNYFTGSINLNYANVKIANELIWQGMDDVGLATRLAIDLSNIDNAGIERIKDIAGGGESRYDLILNINLEYSSSGSDLTVDTDDNKEKISETITKCFNDGTAYPLFAFYGSSYKTSSNTNKRILPAYYRSRVPLNEKPTEFYFDCMIPAESTNHSANTTFYSKTLTVRGNWNENDEFTATYIFCYRGGLDETFVKKNDVITKTNTTSYTPTANYHPATKKYVDDAIISAITTTLGGEY